MNLTLKFGDKTVVIEGVDQLNNPTAGSAHYYGTSKVKTIASVDPEKFDNVEKFVDATCTVNRMEQGLEKLREKGLELDVKNTGEYLKWISQDIAREEADTLFASNLTMKDVGGKISGKARLFFMAAVNESVGVQ